MTQLRFVPALFAASAVYLFSSLSSAAMAPPPGCGDGPACSVGFECTVVGASGCASAPCAAGSSCPEPDPCATTFEMGCTPAHCTADAECAPGMVCHTWTESCPVTDCACAPDTPDCGCGVAACDPQSVSMCTPRYLLPCKAASDCGDGFTCEEQMTGCATTGSNGSGPTPGNADAAPAPAGGAAGDPIQPVPAPNCSPQPTGVFQCVPKQLMCATAAQCPAGWTCESDVVATSPACAPGSNCANEPALPAPTPSPWCHPPYYGVDSSSGLEKPTTPTSGNTGTGTGTGGSTTTGVPPQPESSNADDASSHESAACQMGHAPVSSGALSLLTLLGALFGLKRRRAQR